MHDAVIVGAGPIGCKVGELLGKQGFKALILEKNKEIGKPIQCTGLVSKRIMKLSNCSLDVIVNVVNKARLYSHKRNYLELKHKNKVYVIDREKFDKEMAEMAKNAGTKIKTSTRFQNLEYEKDYLKLKTTKGILKTKLLIGADGPDSTVARISNIPVPENMLIAVQQTVKSFFIPNIVELWFGSEVCPELFCWVVPEDEKYARIGLATPRVGMRYLQKFLRKRIGGEIELKNQVSGLIRFGLIKNSVSERIILVGDAASQVKPFSGGGLIYGLIGAKTAAKACGKSLEKERHDYEFLKKEYDEKWKEKLSWPIKKGMILKKTINGMPDWLFDFSINSANPFKFMLKDADMDLLK